MMLPAEVERKRFTVSEYHRMGETGIIGSDDRVELVEGEVVKMTPIGGRHVQTVNALTDLLSDSRKIGGYALSVQNPLQLGSHSEPQPDIALLAREGEGGEGRRLPAASDVLVVIEVCESSARYDREVKLPLYARAGIPEVWLVDLNSPRVELYTRPVGGGYEVSRTFSAGEVVLSEAIPAVEVAAGEILSSS